MSIVAENSGVLLHHDYLSLTQGTECLRDLSKKEKYNDERRTKGNIQEALVIAQFYLTAAKKTAIALQAGYLSQIDPIVGENTCQVRSYVVIMSFSNKALLEEADKLRSLMEGLLERVKQLKNERLSPDKSLSPSELISELGLSVTISLDMDYLVRSYILSCGKFFQMRADRSESSGINVKQVKMHLADSCPEHFITRMIRIAKEHLARDTILRIQEMRSVLSSDEQQYLGSDQIRTVKTPLELNLEVSCAFYNMKAIVINLFQKKIPIVVVEHSPEKGVHPLRLVYISGKLSFEPLEEGQALFVVEGFIQKGCDHKDLGMQIEKIGLMDFILSNVAQVPQYSEDDDISTLPKKAQGEILKYREMGLDIVKVFHIVHTHAATFIELKGEGR